MDGLRSPNRRSWTPIGETSHQLIVYHPPSHAIQVVPHPDRSALDDDTEEESSPTYVDADSMPVDITTSSATGCPLCGRAWAASAHGLEQMEQEEEVSPEQAGQGHYFRVLEKAHEFSRPGTPLPNTDGYLGSSPARTPVHSPNDYIEEADLPAKGYYERFFKEDSRLGIGAEGSVYLATHVISGSELGRYAVKKIAVGNSKAYLVRMLREVRLLESLRHPNIIPYYHSWVDETRFSSFGPPILALHVLMMYASAGNLDAFLLSRSHGATSIPPLSARDVVDADTENIALLPKAERIKAFKRRRQSDRLGTTKETRGVLLLGLDEICKLFGDVVEGLAFLHANSILHLDLKCSNVLLHWEEGKVVPKALLSDFGTSEEMLRGRRERTGHTGTMEYMAPETLVMDVNGHWRPSDSHADMWSLGIILYRMLFLQSPYQFPDDLAALHGEIIGFQGFKASTEVILSCERRHIPKSLLVLLERLLHVSPEMRPSAERVKVAVEDFTRRGTGRSWSKVWGARGAPSKTSMETTQQRKVAERSPDYFSSPVKAILALPPTAETGESRPVSTHSDVQIISTHKISISNTSIILFIVKMMSLQPALVGIQLPPLIAFSLAGLAIWELLAGPVTGVVTMSLVGVHVGIMWLKLE